jgi:hypothetical protein
LTWGGDGAFQYMPDTDFNGSDSFTYQVSDGLAISNVATVTITIQAVNDGPGRWRRMIRIASTRTMF